MGRKILIKLIILTTLQIISFLFFLGFFSYNLFLSKGSPALTLITILLILLGTNIFATIGNIKNKKWGLILSIILIVLPPVLLFGSAILIGLALE